MKKPFRNAVLPVKYQAEGKRWTPEKARDPAEIARRRDNPGGTLIRELQRDGTIFGSQWFETVQAAEDKKFVAGILAVSLFNTSWHIGAEHAPDVMNRRLHLPILADHESDWRQTAEGLVVLASERLAATSHSLETVVAEHMTNTTKKGTIRRIGNYAGTTALHLAAVQHDATQLAGNPYQVQEGMRAIALDTLEAGVTLADEIGAYPTMAQVHNPYSPVGVHIRSEAPNGALDAYDQLVAASK